MNRLFFRLLLLLALAVPVVISASWFLWLDAPARSNPHDPKSPLYVPLLPNTFTATRTPGGIIPTNTFTNTYTPSATPTPTRTVTKTYTPGANCYAPDKLDLLVSKGDATDPCSSSSETVRFQVYNHSAVPVNVTSLTILGWFDSGVIVGGWGGDNWRSNIYTAAGVLVNGA
ncbi:MAG TPA: hypothetical protein VK842_04700, partial [bacterium]|nr:hypothetical protein [bacterium]